MERDCRALGADLGLGLRFHQSNREYEIIDWVHEAREDAGGIVINPAAFTHTSVAILDALNAFEGPVIEVHISNVHKREVLPAPQLRLGPGGRGDRRIRHPRLRPGAAPGGAPAGRSGVAEVQCLAMMHPSEASMRAMPSQTGLTAGSGGAQRTMALAVQ